MSPRLEKATFVKHEPGGNNLKYRIKDETVDLVYLDPPFNSNRNYNVLFKDESETEAESQNSRV